MTFCLAGMQTTVWKIETYARDYHIGGVNIPYHGMNIVLKATVHACASFVKASDRECGSAPRLAARRRILITLLCVPVRTHG